METENPTTRPTVTLSWLGHPVERPAVEYIGSATSAHGVYGLEGDCVGVDGRGCDRECDGVNLVHPTNGVRLSHVRSQSWRWL